MRLAMGVYDSPQTQKQPVFYMDHCKSHIAVFGGPMSGKTTFVKTFLVRIHECENLCPDEDVYIVDFGGNIGGYGKFNKVCACFDSSNEENIKHLFKTIEKRIEENAKKLGSNNFVTMADKEPLKCPTHITLIIENINAFLNDERYSSYQERLMKFCRDGLSKGLTVLFTANDISGTAKLLSACGQKIVFDMPADNFSEIFNTKVTKPMKLPGRAVINKESECYEFQCFLPFEYEGLDELVFSYGAALEKGSGIDETLSGQINKYLGWKHTANAAAVKKELSRYVGLKNENRLVSFPEALTVDDAKNYARNIAEMDSDPDQIVVGLDYNEHNPVAVNIDKNRTIAIYGKREFGKSNLLYFMIKGIMDKKPGAKFIFLDDGRGELEFFHKFSQDYCSGSIAADSSSNGIRPEYFVDWKAFVEFVKNIQDDKSEDLLDVFKVFVIQSKAFYQIDEKTLFKRVCDMMGDAEKSNYLFIFSDVKRFSSLDNARQFNNQITAAFLLDNVGEFVSDRGEHTVFGGLDAKELKAEYAKCSIGDGYYFETDVMDEPKKVKFLKGPNIPKKGTV